MRAVLQRVRRGRVTVEGREVGAIGAGLVVLLGIGALDGPEECDLLAHKVAGLRIFPDAEGRFNLSALDVGAEMLVISQFTLYADCRRGRRPGFTEAARPELAAPLCQRFAGALSSLGLSVATGEFQAHMLVEIENDGPVTIWLDTDELIKKNDGR
jgi:D-tyrosyl-tRNA(Tyr) deacylase